MGVIEGYSREDTESFPSYRSRAWRAAKELGYSKDIIDRIHKASTFGEIERALIDGRHSK